MTISAVPEPRGPRCHAFIAVSSFLAAALRGSVVRGVRATRGKVLTALGLSSSLLIVHASEYKQKPVDVTKSVNKFASSQKTRNRRSRTVANSEL